MWRRFRQLGCQITSTWIDQADQQETADFSELWDRIRQEIANSDRLVLYAEAGDFPLKGALIEVGMALGMGGRPVVVCLPGIVLDMDYRPIGSWINHPMVTRSDEIVAVMKPYGRFIGSRKRASPSRTQG